MKPSMIHKHLYMIVGVACAVSLCAVGIALAAGPWVDEIANALSFYKASYPTSNFDPYLATLEKIREGANRGDQKIVKVEMDRFLKMLLARTNGINEVAADELYNLAQSVRPIKEQDSAAATGLEITHERLMSVPGTIPQSRDDGRTPCVGLPDGGCDYWVDFMDDYTGG
jgi:hypothetical protein